MDPSTENAFLAAKADPKFKSMYFDLYGLRNDPVNPLKGVTPLEGMDNFFGPYVCNFLVIEGVWLDMDWDDVDKTIKRLKEVYDRFAKFEVHIFINKDTENYRRTKPDWQDETERDLQRLANDGKDVGIIYEGRFGESEMKSRMVEILTAFKSGT